MRAQAPPPWVQCPLPSLESPIEWINPADIKEEKNEEHQIICVGN
jgi:hypothetical protein